MTCCHKFKGALGAMEFDQSTGKWDVNGCCGGGCFVLTDLTHCPWCGTLVATKPRIESKE